MILSVHQPQYLPWLGFFDKISRSDIYVSLDQVQYMNRGFIHRNKIKTPNGWIWLTIPVNYEQGCRIDEVMINNDIDWADRHIKSIKMIYSNTPFFKKYWNELESIYKKKWERLVDFDEELLSWTLKVLGIKVKYLKMSDMKIEGDSTLRIINMCKELGCNTYLSGSGGKEYMDEGLFGKESINLEYQHFEHPVYEQKFGDFIPGLCILDLLFNCGDESLKIIRGEKK
jgi:hypothetical protein